VPRPDGAQAAAGGVAGHRTERSGGGSRDRDSSESAESWRETCRLAAHCRQVQTCCWLSQPPRHLLLAFLKNIGRQAKERSPTKNPSNQTCPPALQVRAPDLVARWIYETVTAPCAIITKQTEAVTMIKCCRRTGAFISHFHASRPSSDSLNANESSGPLTNPCTVPTKRRKSTCAFMAVTFSGPLLIPIAPKALQRPRPRQRWSRWKQFPPPRSALGFSGHSLSRQALEPSWAQNTELVSTRLLPSRPTVPRLLQLAQLLHTQRLSTDLWDAQDRSYSPHFGQPRRRPPLWLLMFRRPRNPWLMHRERLQRILQKEPITRLCRQL